MSSYRLSTLRATLREYERAFLDQHYLRIEDGVGLFIDSDRLVEVVNSGRLLAEEASALTWVHGEHPRAVALVPVPFTKDQWLRFAQRYDVAELWVEGMPHALELCRAADPDAAALVEALLEGEPGGAALVSRERSQKERRVDAVLSALHALGLDPKSLPVRVNGQQGTRGRVWSYLVQQGQDRLLFPAGKQSFHDCWKWLLEPGGPVTREPTRR